MNNFEDFDKQTQLCIRMLQFAWSGANGKTEDMTASDIRRALNVFFTSEQLDAAQRFLTGI